jgi:hypothetical protein
MKNYFTQFNPKESLFTMASLFLLILSIGAIVMVIQQVSRTDQGGDMRTINVTASGDAYQTPDIARFSYTINKEGKDVATTQTETTKISNEVMQKLVKAGVDKKDIRTTTVSANPKYEWQTKSVVCPAGSYCNPDGKNVLVGYESTISVEVTVRDLAKSGEILQVLGASDVTNITGPDFTNEDKDAAQNEARNEALAKARVKARGMADAMGVRLGKVISFSEGMGGGYPMPMMARAEMGMMADAVVTKSAPTLEIASGQEKVTVEVTVTYRIK